MAPAGQVVDVEGRRLVLRNLEKVLYPSTGTTKAEVLAYYSGVAATMLGYLRDRPVTRKRWPDGVGGEPFFEKNLPAGAPAWVRRVTLPVPGSTRDRETITYPLLDDLAGVVWAANLAALELHVPQWTVDTQGARRNPDRLVIDLDPGLPAGLAECVEVASAVRELLAADGLSCFPVSSGGAGMQLYAAVSGEQDADTLRGYARALAERLERTHPRLVVSRMTRALRPGRVLLDWSQNHAAKTTIAPYSLRGRERPTVAAPRSWAELDGSGRGGAALHQLGPDEVTDRLRTRGDLLAGLAAGGPPVPVGGGRAR